VKAYKPSSDFWFVCKNFFDDGTCGHTMCMTCYDKFDSGGALKEDRPSPEEEEAKKQLAETLDANSGGKRKRGGKRTSNSRAPAEGAAATARARSEKNQVTKKPPGFDLYFPEDKPGCAHKDIKKWERESSPFYYQEKNRAIRAKKGKANMDFNCCQCKERI